MAAVPPLRDRLSFLHRLPILLKGTSDDSIPCPGYLFEEIAKISHESLGSSQCLLEYLLNRLDSSSGHVKLKVLKILLYLCGHGSSSFLLILRRNSALIQEATAFSGPPDPLHGNSLYQNSSCTSNLSRASDSGSRSGSDSHSGTSREPGDLAERAEATPPNDCQQELNLVRTVTQGPRVFLSREETQHFIKECGLLNCEAVLELLLRQLVGTSECEQMRALCAIASFGSADLLPQEHVLLLCRQQLQELGAGSPGPVTNKATKILSTTAPPPHAALSLGG